ncbi:hypothetical protein [Gracilibacillus suaedae]|uniref:hypothetical protein n=1 Tax=Gracilibacillus suaedae TaxID=2820273 RepID=UPI001ABDC065|nr:hypothetical protein [Gracilibacillus suaedae]
MNGQLYKYARDKALKELPLEDQKLYQYIESREDTLIEQAITEQHLLALFQEKSPILEAADAFNIAPKIVYESIKRIEIYLENRVQYHINALQFIDLTDLFQLNGLSPIDKKVKIFLLANL